MARTVALLLAAGLLLAAITDAAMRGMADWRYIDARILLAGAARDRKTLSQEALALAQEDVRAARRIERDNPLFVEQLARLHEMRAFGLPPGDAARRDELRRALEEFRAAARMRPGSPYVWAGIAAVKARLDDMDFEFYGALQRAERYGRWEPAIELALADIGLAAWPLLARPAKLLALDAVARALPKQGPELRRIAEAHGTLGQVCAEELRLRGAATGLCVKK